MPKGTPDPHTGEARLAAQLDEIDVLVERYRHAMEYRAWFQPAWDALSDNDRLILSEFYMSGNVKSGACARLEQRLHCSAATVDRNRSKALSRLTLLLFGK